MKNAIAFDLGTKAGWACSHNEQLSCGLINTTPTRFDGAGVRFVKFEHKISELMNVCPPEIVFFERVHRHLGIVAAHVYAGYMTMLTTTCEKRKIPYTGLSVQEIKKYATGRGNADKKLMIMAAKARWSTLEIQTDDVADALWCLHAGLESLKN